MSACRIVDIFINNFFNNIKYAKNLPIVFAVHFVIIRKKLPVEDRHLLGFWVFTGLNVLSDKLFFQLNKKYKKKLKKKLDINK